MRVEVSRSFKHSNTMVIEVSGIVSRLTTEGANPSHNTVQGQTWTTGYCRVDMMPPIHDRLLTRPNTKEEVFVR